MFHSILLDEHFLLLLLQTKQVAVVIVLMYFRRKIFFSLPLNWNTFSLSVSDCRVFFERQNRQNEKDRGEKVGTSDKSGNCFDVNRMRGEQDAGDDDTCLRRQDDVGENDKEARRERVQQDVEKVEAEGLKSGQQVVQLEGGRAQWPEGFV